MSEHTQQAGPKLPQSWDEAFPGRFLKAGELLGKPATVKIKRIYLDSLPDDTPGKAPGSVKVRGVMEFVWKDATGALVTKEIAVNSTNRQCIQAMFGANPQDAVGKRITLVPEVDYFGRDKVDAIRIAGSPDIERDVVAVIKMPKKSPKSRTLTKTPERNQSSQAAGIWPEPPKGENPHAKPGGGEYSRD